MSPKLEPRSTASMPEEDKKIQQALEALRKEYDGLHKKKIETDTTLQNLEDQLEELKKRAEAEYGTSDLEELKAMLARWREENARRIAEYQEHIQSIKEALEKIEGTSETESTS